MSAVPKGRIVGALLLVSMLAPLADARSAHAPLAQSVVASPEESEAIAAARAPPAFTPGDLPSHSKRFGPNGNFGVEELRPEDLDIQSSVPVAQG